MSIIKVKTHIKRELQELVESGLMIEDKPVNTLSRAVMYLIKYWIHNDRQDIVNVRPFETVTNERDRSVRLDYEVNELLEMYKEQTGTASRQQALTSLVRNHNRYIIRTPS